ncbi:uncharacterized protein LOC117609734 [Osmia lignaria lignaria]|uniref:uncharacterized protein LOC117609734 n=1 Tax=Osmia lignaria lignaria TaxID=1437193 RepID=UPI00402B9B5B
MSSESLPTFNPNENDGNVYAAWKRWLRAFELFVASKNVTDINRKKAMLLHHGGLELQDVFYTLPNADMVAEGENAYEKAMDALTTHFKPKLNMAYERHVFRQLKQKEGETMNQYITRLRQQAKNCEFPAEEIEICGQIVEKCTSNEIRRRLLEKGDFKLSDVIEVARTIEAIELQTKDIEKSTVAATRNVKKERKPEKVTEKKKDIQCFRCGYTGHTYKDERCPAKSRTCSKCGKRGHFATVCKSQMTSNNGGRREPPRRVRVRELDGEVGAGQSRYAFGLQTDCQISAMQEGQSMDVKIGGIILNMLIDSGAQCNVVDENTWKWCKDRKIVCETSRYVDKCIYPYGHDTALELLGQFRCDVEVENRKVRASFVVLKGKGRPILGYKTAKELEILRIGLQVNEIDIKREDSDIFRGIGKLKDFKLTIPIDRSHPPVAQPVRRLPFKLRDQINKQLKELLDLDITETVEGPTEWVSPVIPIVKKNGEVRLCVDMRRANEAILRERYPLPVIEKILSRVSTCIQRPYRITVPNPFE